MSEPTSGPTEPGETPEPPPADGAGTVSPSDDVTDAAPEGDAPPPEGAPVMPPPGVTPPPDITAAATDAEASAPWPSSAKVWVGVLAVIALLASIAAVVGFSQASSSDDDRTTVEQERDAAVARAESAEQERDELASELEAANNTIDALTSELAAAEADLEAAQSQNEVLAAAVEVERARADEAAAELAAIGEAFPVTVETSLVGLDVAGSYTISFTEAYCDFATGCGTTPQADQAIIGVTPENFLDITIPGILQGGLFAVNGGLYGITDSETAIEPCGDVPRRGRVTITIWPASIIVAGDGTRDVTNLEASITLDAPTIDDCPSGLVFWGATLTPNG